MTGGQLDVVFLSQRVPYPPDRGDRITTWHILRHFRDRGDRLRVGCFAEDERDRASAARIDGFVDASCCPTLDRRIRKLTSLRGLLSGEALTLPFFRSRRLAGAVDAWMRERPPDLVFVYSSSMAQYALPHTGPVRIMHFAELDSDKWRQYAQARSGLGALIYRREARVLLEYERRVARAFDASLVVSEVERDVFSQRIPDVTPHVVPNGVDVERFMSSGEAKRGAYTLIFTGVMNYEPNVDGILWFCREVWPSVRRAFPEARLLVVGNRPCAEVRALDGVSGVEITGWVAQTVPYFDRATVAIAPLRLARGVQNKVLEAMSMGLPVVATTQAAQGLGQDGHDHLVLADGADATCGAVVELLGNPDRARSIGRGAAAFVRSHFRWEDALAILDRIIAELCSGRGAPGR